MRDGTLEAQTAWIDLLDNNQELVTNRAIGRSWGVNTEGVLCGDPPDEEIRCSEQAGLASTDGGRQFRDAWRALEDQYSTGAKGYFIENDAADCQHCHLTGFQADCVAQYLKFGRNSPSMSQACKDLDEVPGTPAADCSGYPL